MTLEEQPNFLYIRGTISLHSRRNFPARGRKSFFAVYSNGGELIFKLELVLLEATTINKLVELRSE